MNQDSLPKDTARQGPSRLRIAKRDSKGAITISDDNKDIDGGWAWIVLVASFVIQFLIDGVCLNYGVFYIQLCESFVNESSAKILTVGSVIMGVYMGIGPFAAGLTNMLGCRPIVIAGSVIAAVSIGISCISPSVDVLLVTYSLCGGIGFGLMTLPSIVMVSYYFSRRRALATGITVCGSGVGILAFSPFTQFLMETYGWRGATWILAGLVLNGIPCGMVYRPPSSMTRATGSVGSVRRRRSGITPANSASKNAPLMKSGCSAADDADGQASGRCKEPDEQQSAKVVRTEENELPFGETDSLLQRPDVFYSGSVVDVHVDVDQQKSVYHSSSVAVHPSKLDRNLASADHRTRCRRFANAMRRMLDLSPFRSPTFNVLSVGTFISFFGIYAPFSCIGHHAILRVKCSEDSAALLLCVLGGTNTVGRVVSGFIADYPQVDCVLFHNVALLIAGVCTCLLPLCNTYWLICVYLVIFGPTIAVFVSLKSIVVVELLGLRLLTSCYGLTSLGDGMASIAGTPIAGSLFDMTGSYDVSFYVAGVFLVIGSLVCMFLRRVQRWEQSRERTTAT